MNPDNDRGCPPAKGAPSESIATDISILGDFAAACEAYAVVVITEDPDGEVKFVRRLYLSLHSAQKAIRRAELRGRRASLVLCKVVPVQGELIAGSE